MKLDKAIEILTDLLGEGPQYPPTDRRDAVKLGIEALKHIQRLKSYHAGRKWSPLPGETEE